jgi:PBSX family phage terminase large subunit
MLTDTEHFYSPRGSARELFKRRNSEVLVSGPAGTGKSRACLEKVNLACLRTPYTRALIVRKTLASLGATGLMTWREKVVAEGLAYGVLKFFGGSAQEPAQYRYQNGSVVVIGGMDKATKIMSSEYDLIYVQEATELTEDDWEVLTTRLRNGRLSFQQIIADCNPDRPTHWLKVRCDQGKCVMLNSTHRENPVYYSAAGELTESGESYLEKLSRLSGVRKLRLLEGKWVAADGLVYDEYDQTKHLLDRFEIPQNWKRWWAVDFGYTNPFVCQFWAEDPDGRLFLYREIYMTRKTVDQHAKDIAFQVIESPKKTGDSGWSGIWKEPKPQAVICDHDAEGRKVLERELGLPTKNAEKKVLEGVQAVQRRLREEKDGKPRIFFLRDSLVSRDQELEDAKRPCCTVDELTGYIWEQGRDQLKENPRKQDDHGMDAMRYLVADRDLRSSVGVRWL